MNTFPGVLFELANEIADTEMDSVDSEYLISMAFGTAQQWSDYLKGPKTQSIVRNLNDLLSPNNLQLISRGVNTQQWQIVSVAEASNIKLDVETLSVFIDVINAASKGKYALNKDKI